MSNGLKLLILNFEPVTRQEREKFNLEELVKYRDISKDGMEYSIKRIDILIIVLSSSGIYLIVTELKKHSSDTILLIAVYLFATSIIFNLLSQFISYKMMKGITKLYNDKINAYLDNPQTFDESIYKETEDNHKNSNAWVEAINYTSFILLTLGILSSLFYYL